MLGLLLAASASATFGVSLTIVEPVEPKVVTVTETVKSKTVERKFAFDCVGAVSVTKEREETGEEVHRATCTL